MKLNIFKISKPVVFCTILLSLKSMLVSAQVAPQFWQLNNSPNTLTWDKTPWDTQIDNSSGSFTATSVNWMGNNGRSCRFLACKDIVFGGNPGANPAGTVTLSSASNSVKSLAFHPAASGNFTIASSPATNSITSCSTDLPVSVDSGLSPIVSSVFSGSNSLTKNGSGTLTLAGNNTYTGATNVTEGILQIGNGGTTGTTGTGVINVNAGMLDYNRSSNFTTTNPNFFAKANTVIRKRGASTMTIGNPTLTTKITMDAGATLDIVGGVFATGGGLTQVYQNNKGSLNIASGAQLNIFGDNGFFDALTGNGSYYNSWQNNVPGRHLTLGISNTANNAQYGVANNTAVFAGVISIIPSVQGEILLDLIKVGTGTQVLSGSNIYRNTTINGGTLVANNTTALGSGVVTINSGGTLTLNADIANAITVNAGGTLNKNGHTTGLVTGSGTVNP